MKVSDPSSRGYFKFWMCVWPTLTICGFMLGLFISLDFYSTKGDNALQAIVDNLQDKKEFSYLLDEDSDSYKYGKLGIILSKYNINLDPHRNRTYDNIKIEIKKSMGKISRIRIS